MLKTNEVIYFHLDERNDSCWKQWGDIYCIEFYKMAWNLIVATYLKFNSKLKTAPQIHAEALGLENYSHLNQQKDTRDCILPWKIKWYIFIASCTYLYDKF